MSIYIHLVIYCCGYIVADKETIAIIVFCAIIALLVVIFLIVCCCKCREWGVQSGRKVTQLYSFSLYSLWVDCIRRASVVYEAILHQAEHAEAVELLIQ